MVGMETEEASKNKIMKTLKCFIKESAPNPGQWTDILKVFKHYSVRTVFKNYLPLYVFYRQYVGEGLSWKQKPSKEVAAIVTQKRTAGRTNQGNSSRKGK